MNGLEGEMFRTDAFIERVLITDDCWEWIGRRHSAGYGRIPLGVGGKDAFAHRVSYELFVGPIPERLTIDHLCRNRRCVRPSHLEAVTLDENKRRGMSPAAVAARRTHCLRGHLYDGVTMLKRKGACRYCKTCAREKMAARRRVQRIAS